MIDTLLKHREKAKKSDILERLGLIYASTDNRPASLASESVAGRQRTTNYCVLTLHRPSNVDEKETFQGILEALSVIAKDIPIIFPAHPRTLNRIKVFGFEKYFNWALYNSMTPNNPINTRNSSNSISPILPLGYLDFLQLMANAKLVLTDSGGIQEETTILGLPCVTLRENTERPVTVSLGTNIVAGTNKENIIGSALSQLSEHKTRGKSKTPAFWDGNVGTRIVDVLLKNMA
jgi:UDP-N-acetylglucosamine 2-epimerase (non-hydrolysing)